METPAQQQPPPCTETPAQQQPPPCMETPAQQQPPPCMETPAQRKTKTYPPSTASNQINPAEAKIKTNRYI
jgi:hypothetical protein